VNESETSVAVTRRVVNQKKFVLSYSDCHLSVIIAYSLHEFCASVHESRSVQSVTKSVSVKETHSIANENVTVHNSQYT